MQESWRLNMCAGQCAPTLQVPHLMVTVFVRAVYARLLLVQMDNVGAVLVINIMFAFVQIIGSVTKRSNDDLLIKASCRDFRMAWAYQATKTYNHVLLSARLIEAASENAAIWATAAINWYAHINLAAPGTPPIGTDLFISAACQVRCLQHSPARLHACPQQWRHTGHITCSMFP